MSWAGALDDARRHHQDLTWVLVVSARNPEPGSAVRIPAPLPGMKGVHMATRAATKTRDAEVEVDETVTVAADETTKPAAKKAGAKAAPKKATAKAGTAKTAAKKQTAPKGKATDDDDLDDDAEVEIDDEEVVAVADDTE